MLLGYTITYYWLPDWWVLVAFAGNGWKYVPVSRAVSVSAYLFTCHAWKVTERI